MEGKHGGSVGFFYLGLVSFFLMMVVVIALGVIWVGSSQKKLHMAMIILGMVVVVKLGVCSDWIRIRVRYWSNMSFVK